MGKVLAAGTLRNQGGPNQVDQVLVRTDLLVGSRLAVSTRDPVPYATKGREVLALEGDPMASLEAWLFVPLQRQEFFHVASVIFDRLVTGKASPAAPHPLYVKLHELFVAQSVAAPDDESGGSLLSLGCAPRR